MTLSKAYFLISIIVGLDLASVLFDMLAHSDSSSNNYFMLGVAILWVPLSLIAALCFLKRPLYCLSPVSYVAYFVINYFTSPENSFHAEFDATHIACVIFGVFFTALNTGFLIREIRREKRTTIETPAIEHSAH